MKSIAYVGMDVHKDPIAYVLLPSGSETPISKWKLINDKIALKKWITKRMFHTEERVGFASEVGCGKMAV